MDLIAPDDLPHAFTLVDLPPERILPLVARLGAGLFDRRMTIGLFPSAAPRPAWRAVLGGFDAILTPGAWSAQALAGITGRTVLPRRGRSTSPGCARQRSRPATRCSTGCAGSGATAGVSCCSPWREGDDPAARGLDLFLALARQDVGRRSRVPTDSASRPRRAARPGPGLAPLLGDAPVLLIDEPWDEGQLAALRALADVAVFPDRSPGNERAALASIALGVPTLVSLRADLPDLLGADYPLGIPGRLREPADPARGDAPWFEPDAEALARLLRRACAGAAPLPALAAPHRDPARPGRGRAGAARPARGPLRVRPPARRVGRDARRCHRPGLHPRPGPARAGARPRRRGGARAALHAGEPDAKRRDGAAGRPCRAGLARLGLVSRRRWHARASRVAPGGCAHFGRAGSPGGAAASPPGGTCSFPAPGDRLAPGLLAAYAARIATDPAPDLLYCDTGGARHTRLVARTPARDALSRPLALHQRCALLPRRGRPDGHRHRRAARSRLAGARRRRRGRPCRGRAAPARPRSRARDGGRRHRDPRSASRPGRPRRQRGSRACCPARSASAPRQRPAR